jgi:hypothetical protein
MAGKSGWDGPLEVDWDFAIDDLRDELVRWAPGAGGALRSDLRAPEAVTINKEMTEIRITIQPPALSASYALAQDEGAIVPPYKCPPRISRKIKSPYSGRNRWATGIYRFPNQGGIRPYGERSWVMTAMIGGVQRFFTSRRGFRITGVHYVDRAIATWWDRLVRGQSGTPVQWRAGFAGQTFGETRGRVSG